MSVFDTPKVHFAGTAVTRLPTGPRSGQLDLATNRPVDTSDGGRNPGGNGHFWVDAKVVGCELRAGEVDTTEPLVGRSLDLWGHYCAHLGSTANRARVFDVDPASNWTTTVMLGQLALGRLGRSHEVGYLVTGYVTGMCPPRWQNWSHIVEVCRQPLASWFRHSVVHQFALEHPHWLDGAEYSPALTALRSLLAEGEADGLVVQFALTNMATPAGNDQPDRWDLRGTLAPWHASELRTYPAGRLLYPPAGGPLHNLTVRVDPSWVGFNLVTALPVTGRAPRGVPGGTHRLGPLVDHGDLWLRAESGEPLARVPRELYLGPAYRLGSGVLTVPRLNGDSGQPLVVTAGESDEPLLVERQTVVQTDEAALFLEHPDATSGRHFPVRVPVRSYVRGEPAAVPRIRVRQFVNPRGLPRDPVAASPSARAADLRVAAFRAGEQSSYLSEVRLATDRHGTGVLDLRGVRGGSARVLLLPDGDPPPVDETEPGSATVGYDNDDSLGYWSSVGSLAVRVLPDHWHLDALADEEITFELLYREVFEPYERLYSFMRDEVFSLAEECKVEPYARLTWHACDPGNRDKTFYMPPTRDLTAPQTRLLRRYMFAVEATRQGPVSPLAAPTQVAAVTTRENLLDALRHAAAIELAGMTQYLYAAYSIPTHTAATRLVTLGEWTPAQLRLACGDGPDSLRGGMRGSLLAVAKEEMIHFLVVNNIIMAMGEPFHLPEVDFGTFNANTRVPLEFALERFGLGSVQRFIDLERPHTGLAQGDGYGSLSELYAAIRDGLHRVPDALLVDRGAGGGQHHLFMRESVNAVHPDYQLEVDDLASALFAIDFVTEHGEGGVLGDSVEESHYATFQRLHRELATQAPWSPSYPVPRNPTLGTGTLAKEPLTYEPARQVATVFNRTYATSMQLMVQHFAGWPDDNPRRARLMNWALDLMVGVLRPTAELLVTVPSGRPGYTAGPTFELDRIPEYLPRPAAAATRIARELDDIAALADKCDNLSHTVAALLRHTADDLRANPPG
ncbi:hypothetical protein GCM10023321_41290 [Pseudonocardia eucalypti]|uniref:Iminophenyl-pyruvate dimer synthase domain-containing protein n=1 Tax=Pseudonocardia eucalypti TaxID=648755 RepID=A0ABP9QCR2_9PSEU|nr:hypothetical protein [Pseudonocardia eucalypti]